ncbi:MAG TPA: glycosyltransferase family 87 protein, partial [bacterium]|nr:glycosyltransferase family 87 protein [bacterium]
MDPKRLVGIALICFGVVFYVQRNIVEAVQGHGNDFAHLYLGARALQQNVNPYDGAEIRRLAEQSGIPRMNPYVYPPLMAIAMKPLAGLRYDEARQIWFLVNQVFLLLSFVLLLLLWRPKSPMLAAGFLAVVYAFFFPLTRTLTAGQLNALLLLLLAVAACLERSGWSFPAGAVMGLASIIKVYPAIFLVYYVGRGNWKAVCSMVIAIVVLLGISVSVAGVKTHLDYFP